MLFTCKIICRITAVCVTWVLSRRYLTISNVGNREKRAEINVFTGEISGVHRVLHHAYLCAWLKTKSAF